MLLRAEIHFQEKLIYFIIILGMVLGQGNFGRVIKAEAIGILENEIGSTVAVKMAKGRH